MPSRAGDGNSSVVAFKSDCRPFDKQTIVTMRSADCLCVDIRVPAATCTRSYRNDFSRLHDFYTSVWAIVSVVATGPVLPWLALDPGAAILLRLSFTRFCGCSDSPHIAARRICGFTGRRLYELGRPTYLGRCPMQRHPNDLGWYVPDFHFDCNL